MKTSKTLSPEQVRDLLAEHPNWSLEGGMLVRTWTLPSFAEAIAFVNRVAAFAEDANHHPDIDIRYTRVRVALSSHDVAALSPRDAAMVARLDRHSPTP